MSAPVATPAGQPTGPEPPVREVPEQLRSDRGLPYFGRIFEFAKDPVALMRHQWETYGPVAPMRSMGQSSVMLLGPDACETALRNKDKAFASGPAWAEIVGPFFHRGLMLLDFEEHHAHRRIMQEAFTRDRLEAYTRRMHPAIAQGTADWVTDRRFRAYPALKQLTLDIAAEIFMGGAEDTTREQMDRVNRAFIACVQAAAGSSGPTCRSPGGAAPTAADACSRTSSATTCPRGGRPGPTTSSRCCATSRPRTASGSATTTSSTT